MKINFLIEDNQQSCIEAIIREANRKRYSFRELKEVEGDDLVIAYASKRFTIKQALKAYDNV